MSGRVVQATLRPGQPGTRKLAARYGERLVCVRHRIDPERGYRIVTVELVVAEAAIALRAAPAAHAPPRFVHVRIDLTDRALRQRVIAAGGRWVAGEQCWELPAEAARALRLRPTGGVGKYARIRTYPCQFVVTCARKVAPAGVSDA